MTAEDTLEEFIELSASVLDKQGVDAQARTMVLKRYIDNLLEKHGISKDMHLLTLDDRTGGCKLCVLPHSFRHTIANTQ